jgi:hypothetical protein
LLFKGGGLLNGITTNDHLDIDSDMALYRFNYNKIMLWHGNPKAEQIDPKLIILAQ